MYENPQDKQTLFTNLEIKARGNKTVTNFWLKYQVISPKLNLPLTTVYLGAFSPESLLIFLS